MAWCRQATSHYLSQCWPRSVLPYGITSPQWVNLIVLLWWFQEAGFKFVELNASDTRSKKSLENEVAELLNNHTLQGCFGGKPEKMDSRTHCLVMDEVDGMAGNEDRGGMAVSRTAWHSVRRIHYRLMDSPHKGPQAQGILFDTWVQDWHLQSCSQLSVCELIHVDDFSVTLITHWRHCSLVVSHWFVYFTYQWLSSRLLPKVISM